MKNRKYHRLRSASMVASLTLALSATASQAADYVKGYITGSSSQLLAGNGGIGAELFVDEASTGGGDMTADGGAPNWGWEIPGNWVNGDKVEITGIAMPIWANNADTDGTQNTQNATHRISFYSCGANDSFDGIDVDGDTLIGEVDVTFALADAGVDEYYVNFDTPVEWTSADSTKFYFNIKAIELPAETSRAMRFKTGTQNTGTAVIKNKINGSALNVSGSSTTLLSVAGIVNDNTINISTWHGDGGADGIADWDTSSSNWDAGAGVYADGDFAVFDETYDGNSSNVNLVGSLSPLNVKVENTAGGSIPLYEFSGTGNLTGEMGLIRSGNGTLTLSTTGVNDYTGATTITQGTIQLGANDVLSAASVLQIGGTGTSKLVMDGYNAEIGGLQSLANNTRVIENNTLGSVLTVNVADTESYNYTSNFTGTAGAISIVKTGLGTQIFTRAGGYSSDILDVSANGGLLVWNVKGNSGTVTVAPGGILQIGNGGTSGGVGSGVDAGNVGDANITNDGEVIFDRTDAVSYSGVISGSGVVRLNAGVGITLNAAQTYSGDTYLGLGSITATAANQLSPDSVLRVGGFSGGISAVEISGFDQTIAGLAINGGNTREIQNNSGSTATLTIDVETGETHDYGANLTGTDTIDIVKDGLGTQTFNRNNFTTDPGSITVNAGTLNWFVNDTYGAVTVNDTATIGFDRTGTAASFTAASGSTTNYNVSITDWTGAAGTGWPLLTVSGDFAISAAQPSFTVIIDDSSITNFSEANASFVIASVGGTMGAVTADFTVDQSGFTSGTGTFSVAVNGQDVVLSYAAGASDPYATWAAAKSLTAPNAGKTDDKDNDGIKNELEWVLGGDPLVSDTSILPTVEKSGSNLIFTFNRADETIGAVSLIVQYGDDLVGWTDEIVPELTSGIFTITDNGATDQVVATIPTGVATEQFARLKTTTTP